MRLKDHKKDGLWAGWVLFLVRVVGSVTGPEVPGRGRSGPQKNQPEPSLAYIYKQHLATSVETQSAFKKY